MPQAFFLIDGYNLMHAVGLARKRYGPGELEKGRERFLGYLGGRLTEEERTRTVVVFDAGDASVDGPRVIKRRGMRIEFAPSDSDADTRIEQLIAKHSAPRQLNVVS